ncbi:hypothetical protein WCLP8_1880021 [uncultured Gammaproteobacteria bacterium]
MQVEAFAEETLGKARAAAKEDPEGGKRLLQIAEQQVKCCELRACALAPRGAQSGSNVDSRPE